MTEIDGADSPSPTVSLTSLTVGEAPTAVAITPDGQTAYVTNAVSDSVTVIENADSSAPSVTSTIPDIQSRPSAVAVDPVGVSDLNDPQTVTFTTTPPLSMYPGGANFVTSASSSSGLPVVLSTDPSSTDVCEIGGTTVIPSHRWDLCDRRESTGRSRICPFSAGSTNDICDDRTASDCFIWKSRPPVPLPSEDGFTHRLQRLHPDFSLRSPSISHPPAAR